MNISWALGDNSLKPFLKVSRMCQPHVHYLWMPRTSATRWTVDRYSTVAHLRMRRKAGERDKTLEWNGGVQIRSHCPQRCSLDEFRWWVISNFGWREMLSCINGEMPRTVLLKNKHFYSTALTFFYSSIFNLFALQRPWATGRELINQCLAV